MAPHSLVARTLPVFLALALGCLGCDREKEQAPPPRLQEQSAQSPATPPPPPAPWYVGTWRGTAELEGMLPPPLAEREALGKKIDDRPELPTENLHLEIEIDEEQVISGTIAGKGRIYGRLDGETLRSQLVYSSREPPTETADVRRGILLGRREGQTFAGTLKLSAGDSSFVRHGPVRLEKMPESKP